MRTRTPSPSFRRFLSPSALLRASANSSSLTGAPVALLATLTAVASVLAWSAPAHAQPRDVNPPPHNVLLLVDTSGSMEYVSTGKTTGAQEVYPTCYPAESVKANHTKSRWIDLIEVLTGSINDYGCYSQSRSTPAFKTEFSLGGTEPYDFQYPMPYHRPVSNNCVPGPGTLDTTNAFLTTATPIGFHRYDTTGACTGWQQGGDGLLDSFDTLLRFSLMTFDTQAHAGTGFTGSKTPDSLSGIAGLWSYYVNSPRKGWPELCVSDPDFELGARNGAAPPWEGKLVNFGKPAQTKSELLSKNRLIQQVITATRPYGGTPIAGMLHDARDYLFYDTRADPAVTSPATPVDGDFGPYQDPFVVGGCRKNHVILLTDGEPNLDLRGSQLPPYCRNDPPGPPGSCTRSGPGDTNGCCPYAKPEDIAYALANDSTASKRVQVHVVGFAMSEVDVGGTKVKCNALTQADVSSAAGSLCASNTGNRELQTCCTLNRIAFKGTPPDKTPENALFATNAQDLRTALSSILSNAAKTTTSRTLPVVGSGGAAGSRGTRLFTSFIPYQNDPWEGVIERQRITCTSSGSGPKTATVQKLDPALGDDLVAATEKNAVSRAFYSVNGLDTSGVNNERSMRPSGGLDDGLGTYRGTSYSGAASAFVTLTDPRSMAVTGATCGKSTATECRDVYMKWLVGLSNNEVDGNGKPYHRCPNSGSCSLIGDIYYSTPAMVGPPSENLRDSAYEAFATKYRTAPNARPPVIYTSTNDGFLHAFRVDLADDTTNPELWALIPPAVLPQIPSQYPPTHQRLLDAPPIVRDVPATETGLNTNVFKLERTGAGTQAGESTWRTVLVQAFGPGRSGYFAVDVTQPDPAKPNGGPKFLWQLTTDDAGNPLFGEGGGTPLITSVYMKDPADLTEKEIAVAVLPGGAGTPNPGATPTGACPRAKTDWPGIPVSHQPRTSVRCWADATRAAHSLTIVRLDNGQVLRTFRKLAADGPPNLMAKTSLFGQTALDSPITGAPAAFPGGVGTVAERLYIGDADGGMWRVDLSDPDSTKWSMALLFDLYAKDGPTEAQPVMTAPVLSVDDLGQATIATSTGDQDVLSGATGVKNYIFSLSDKRNSVSQVLESKLNWFMQFKDGERVAGPLSIFNKALYFSTYAPPASTSTAVCGNGGSALFGMDYILPKDASDLALGGKGALPDPTNTTGPPIQKIDQSSSLLKDGATVFGVTVAQMPTCYDDVNTADPYIGGGSSVSKPSSVSPGKFQLVVQTGSSGTALDGGQTRALVIDLKSPATTPRIQSWAAIID